MASNETPHAATVCPFFLQGRCWHGENCKLAHQDKALKINTEGLTLGRPRETNHHRPSQKDKGARRTVCSPTSQGPSQSTTRKPKVNIEKINRLCNAWKAGNCTWGSRCKYNHFEKVLPGQVDTGNAASSNPENSLPAPENRVGERPSTHGAGSDSVAEACLSPLSEVRTPKQNVQSRSQQPRPNGPQAGERICYAWRAGNCTRGNNCKFKHDVQKVATGSITLPRISQNTSRVTTSTGGIRAPAEQLAREEATRKVQAEQEAARKANEARIEAVRAELVKQEAAFTTRHVVLGSTLVTCGAGIDIHHIMSGFESCWLLMKGLPRNAKHAEIVELLIEKGADRENLFIETKPSGTHLEAKVLTETTHGQALASDLNGIDFKGETIQVEVIGSTTPNAMGRSSGRDCDLLTISWPAPSVSMVATYATIGEAQAKVRALNGTMYRGRRIRVVLDRPPVRPVRRLYQPETVKINGLGPDITTADVALLAETHTIRPIKLWNYDLQEALQTLRYYVEEERGSFEVIHDGSTDSNVVVQSRFANWDEAKQVRDAISRDQPLRAGYPQFHVTLPDPLKFVILIPYDQYSAQKRTWDVLAEGKNDNKKCRLWIQVERNRPVFIRLTGDDKKAVGALKVRIETLAAGEKLDASFWHRSFAVRDGSGFFARVLSETGVYVRSDWRTHTLKLCGDKKDDARKMIADEIARLAQLEWSFVMERRVVGYFVRKGLGELKEIIGDDAVTLDLSTRKLTVRGGEEARHTLDRLLNQAHEELRIGGHNLSESSDECPICYDEVTHPIQLGCSHIYCTACIRHYLISASDTKIFPLACMGNEAKCRVAIPIPIIQRFLTQEQFFQVVDVAFSIYLDQNSKDFKYCTTPDCTQIYRCNVGTTKCPSCFAEVCSSCHQESHDGMTCQERKDKKQAEEGFNDDWAALHNMKKCPSCRVWIEKNNGCNHMTCRCGAHICWKCMKVCASTEVYEHLRTEHGGVYDEIIDDRQVALELQRELVAQDGALWREVANRQIALMLQQEERVNAAAAHARAARQPLGRAAIQPPQGAARQPPERAVTTVQPHRGDQRGGCIVM